MRVLIDVSAVPAQPVGAGVYVTNLVRALAAPGDLDLRLLARRGDAVRWQALAPGAPVHPAVPAARPLRLAWEQLAGSSLAARLGVDVWHGPHYTVPLRVPARRVVTVHDLTFFDHPELHERKKVVFFRRMIRAAVRRAHALVAVSDATARRLEELLHPSVPVIVAPHGVDHEHFSPHPRPGEAEALAAIGASPPYVVCVGTLEPRKNVPGLVAAFARLHERHPDLSLVLAGKPGWGVRAVERAVAEHGVADRVVLTGYVAPDLVPALYRLAAAVVYPSYAEGFGLPVLEALACGAPVVTTAGTAMADTGGDAAVCVPSGDVDALAAAIEQVVTDGALRDRLCRAGPAVARRHTWEACARAHLDAYAAAVVRS